MRYNNKKARTGIIQCRLFLDGAEGRTRPIGREPIGTCFSTPAGWAPWMAPIYRVRVRQCGIKQKTCSGIIQCRLFLVGAEGRTRPIGREPIGTCFSTPAGWAPWMAPIYRVRVRQCGIKQKTCSGIIQCRLFLVGAEGRTRPIGREPIGTCFSTPAGWAPWMAPIYRVRVRQCGIKQKTCSGIIQCRLFLVGAEGRTRTGTACATTPSR